MLAALGAGLTDTVTHRVANPRFGHGRPPDARLSADPASATAGASFRFDASDSADVDGPPDHLFFRWDWENDGIFDTDWSFDRGAEHEFTKAGQHAVRAEVGDLDDMTASAIAWPDVCWSNPDPATGSMRADGAYPAGPAPGVTEAGGSAVPNIS